MLFPRINGLLNNLLNSEVVTPSLQPAVVVQRALPNQMRRQQSKLSAWCVLKIAVNALGRVLICLTGVEVECLF